MRNPRVYSWSDVSATAGLLFFAQRLEECLHDYSLDTYKAPALNTHTRCLELIRTIEDVRAGAILAKTLRPIVDELCDSMTKDNACRSLVEGTSPQLFDPKWWEVEKPARLQVQAQLLRGYLWKRAYERELRAQLRRLIPPGKDKAAIQSLTVNLAVEWMRMRFSRDYVYYRTRTFFFGFNKVSSEAEQELDKFFAFFEPSTRKFDVCFRATASLAALQTLLPTDVAAIAADAPERRSNAPKERAFLGRPHDGVFIVVPGVDARDARSAREEAARRLETVSTWVAYHVHRTPLKWEGEALVWDSGKAVILKPSRLPVHKEDECSLDELPTRVRSTIGALSSAGLPQESWVRLMAALGLHASAVSSQDVSVQLTTLWSAIETLIPGTADESRIGQVTDVMVPILAARYPWKLLKNIDRSLRRCAGSVYEEVLEAVPAVGRPNWLRCGELIGVQEHEPLRRKLYAGLPTNPLLKNRILVLHQTFGDGGSTLAAIERHKERIEWHVRRIYRSRNLLVHAGHALPYREAIVENLHSYFHSVVNALEFAFADHAPPPSLDAAFMRERLLFEQHIRMLRGRRNDVMSSENVVALLAGPGRYLQAEAAV